MNDNKVGCEVAYPQGRDVTFPVIKYAIKGRVCHYHLKQDLTPPAGRQRAKLGRGRARPPVWPMGWDGGTFILGG